MRAVNPTQKIPIVQPEQKRVSGGINILGINISADSKTEVLDKVKEFLRGQGGHYIVTPNPEIILRAAQDEEYFYILNKADLAIPDGIGLKFAAWALGRNVGRITGADLTRDILRLAEREGLKVAIVNRRDSLSGPDDIRQTLVSDYPNLRFVIEEADREWDMPYYREINALAPDILFVALGAPWQEKFIYRQLPKMPFVKLGLGIGGSFDFLTGKIKRAPARVRAFGMEWLWRIFQEPRGRRLWRLGRIYRAAVVFPLKFIRWRFIRPFLYRENVVCLLYKKVDGRYEILIVARKNDPTHWQLPQGGTDGDDLQSAGIRELSEELNTNKFKPKAIFKKVYRYNFGDGVSRAGILSRYIYGYRGQRQGLFIAEFFGKNEDIKINFWDHADWKWVDSKNLVKEVYPIRRQATKIFLQKFQQVSQNHEIQN